MRQKILAQTRERGSIRAAEENGRNCEIELIDEIALEQGAEERRAPFTSHEADTVFASQLL